MKKSIILIAAMFMTSVMTFAQKVIRVSTDKTDLVMKVSPKGRLYQVYLGDKFLNPADYDNLKWDVELQPKKIRIDDIELTSFDPERMQMSIRVACGKGTYIRALARDIGRALDSGAYLTQLCRTRSGEYRVEDCLELAQFEEWLANQTIETTEDE